MVKMKKAALGAFGMASLNAFGVGFGDDSMDVQNQVSYDPIVRIIISISLSLIIKIIFFNLGYCFASDSLKLVRTIILNILHFLMKIAAIAVRISCYTPNSNEMTLNTKTFCFQICL